MRRDVIRKLPVVIPVLLPVENSASVSSARLLLSTTPLLTWSSSPVTVSSISNNWCRRTIKLRC